MRIAAGALLVLASGASLDAHDGHAHAAASAGALSPWDIAVIAALVASGAIYLRGALRLRARGAVQPRREPLAFACGWLVLLVSVLPPLDALVVELFSAHMLQHELMMLVGAPLVMAGRPISTWLWGLPPNVRTWFAGLLQRPHLALPWRAATAPVVAWALHGIAIWAWHIPRLYDAAVANEGLHALQHATFVGTSALFWWGLLYGRYGRAGYGAAVFYVFTTVVHTGILGAMLTFAGVPLYPAYLAPAAARGIDPLVDQQLAGLVMWIPAGIVLTLLGVGLFAAWLGEAERRQRRAGSTT
jgi:putative membrane protein